MYIKRNPYRNTYRYDYYDRDYDYRRRYYDTYRYPYSIYDSQLSSNYQSINNFGNLYNVNQINEVNQIMGRYYRPYWF